MRRRDFVVGLAASASFVEARAQVIGKSYRIAVVSPYPAPMQNERFREVFVELDRLGYVEGGNLVIERYSRQNHAEDFTDLAREVVRSKPDSESGSKRWPRTADCW